MSTRESYETASKYYSFFSEEEGAFREFLRAAHTIFEGSRFCSGNPPLIYTVKSRIKSKESTVSKLSQKIDGSDELSSNQCYGLVKDFAAVRAIHLHNGQFKDIHHLLIEHINKHYHLDGTPEAYSWDANLSEMYRSLNIIPKVKESYYTSVHYSVKPRPESFVCCEIQVRTLFEEIWGEIDHTIKYKKTDVSEWQSAQLRSLSKLIACGSTLAEGLFMKE